MASMWQKTLFYLGLVDEEDGDRPPQDVYDAPTSGVRTVDPPGSRVSRKSRPGSETPADEQAHSYEPPSSVAGRRVEPPARQRRRISGNPEHAEAGVLVYESGTSGSEPPPVVRNIPVSHEAVIIEARTFSDAQVLADHIRDGQPVVLDLRATEPAMVRRLVDFATGLTYALDGRMAKTAQGVILVTPAGGALAVEEQDRLADLGLYTVSR